MKRWHCEPRSSGGKCKSPCTWQAKDAVRILGEEGHKSKIIFLMCHGNERGIVLPELGPDIEQDQPCLFVPGACVFVLFPLKVFDVLIQLIHARFDFILVTRQGVREIAGSVNKFVRQF